MTITHALASRGTNRKVINCPDTSSTTNAPGSFLPSRDSARVEAHTPTSVPTVIVTSKSVVCADASAAASHPRGAAKANGAGRRAGARGFRVQSGFVAAVAED